MASKRNKSSKTKRSTKAVRKGMTALERADRQLIDQTVSTDAQRHGHYEAIDFKLVEVVEAGKVQAKTAKVVRNRGGTPIDRWHANGGLDDRQMAAILFYSRAWHLVFQEPRVVAKWSAVHTFGAAAAVEVYASTRIAARESLRLIDNEIFFRLPVEHFQVFQNVVLFDEPAGTAGGRAGFTHKAAEGAARVIVAIVASMVADLVIDGAKTDFDLPAGWDVDAPRKPAGRRAA